MIALTAKTLLTPLQRMERPWLLLDGENIAEVSSAEIRQVPSGCRVIDFEDGILAPGYIDIHNHGGAGYDVMQADCEGMALVASLLARHGVTSYLPTTVTAPLDFILKALERLANAIESAEMHPTAGCARPMGIHLEGPFLSHNRRGMHPPESLRLPSIELFERFWQAARGHIRIMTIAPELDGALEVIAAAAARGVCVAIGHSDADLSAARSGVAAGARHATHTFNAMRPFNHRDPGIIGEVLTNSQISADIIADGVHVDPAAVKLFLQMKGPEKSVLITDATPATGMPAGRYCMGAVEFEVRDGKCLVNGVLAGSLLILDQAVRNAMRFAGWELQSAVRAATANPAQIAGVPLRGTLQAGSIADIVVLSPNGEVKTTIIGGRLSGA